MGFTPPYLEVRKITGGYKVYPPTNTTGDDLTIQANGTDTYPNIKMHGNVYMVFSGQTGQSSLRLATGSTEFMAFHIDGATSCYITAQQTNSNIELRPNGTGKVKFGTHTAQADTPVTGYIDILDASGTARKLAVISP